MPDIQAPPAKIVVQNVFSRIYGVVRPEVEHNLGAVLSYRVQDAKHIIKAFQAKRGDDLASQPDWDGVIPLYWPSKGHRFYTGMMSDVLDVLDQAGMPYRIDDRREVPARNLADMKFAPPPTKFERPYQNIVIASMIKATRGIMQAATGSGKTYMMTKLIGSLKGGPFLFFVPSVDILDQAHECLSDCLSIPIGRVGDSHFDIREVNVVMVQMAVKAANKDNSAFRSKDYKFDEEDDWDDKPLERAKAEALASMLQNARGIYMDEVHHAASRTCQDIMHACPNAYWRYGGSATPYREDGAEKMIKALFGQVVQKISASWLIRKNYLVKPYIYSVRMTGDHGTYDSYPEVYKHYIVHNDDLNQLVARLAIKLRNMGIPTLILVQQYPHGDAIKRMLPDAPFIKGNMPRTKRRAAIAGLRDGTVPCAIATTLADEGLDVERLGAVIVAGGGKSITRVYQRVGRTLRTFPEKTRALAFLFHHDAKFLDKHGKKVQRLLGAEPEFSIRCTDQHRIIDDVDAVLRPDDVGLFA